MNKKFDLNIEKVLENWGVSDGIRELIANALDEQILTKTKDVQIFESKESWHIKDFGRGVEYSHLTQKENKEKLSNPERIIGKFGVGLKDALATFDRHGVKIEIISKFGKITIAKSEKANFKDIKTLHAFIEDSPNKEFIGTEIILTGCSKNDIDLAKSNFLKFSGETLLEKTKYGEVYAKKNDALIYITGLKVATEENFLFSYNVTSMTKKLRKALNRERSNVGRTAYTDRIKEILLSCESEKVAELIANDFSAYQTGEIHDEISWIEVQEHACKLINQKRKVVFATTTDLIEKKSAIDDARKDGYEIISIPDNLKYKINDVKDYDGNNIRTVSEYVQQYNSTFEFEFIAESKLTNKEKKVFVLKEELFKIVGGKPKQIRFIKISETMRKDEFGYETKGLWQPLEQTIIIKREQLQNIASFSSTLLHETAHVLSSADDVTREFEIELTKLIGLAISNYTEN